MGYAVELYLDEIAAGLVESAWKRLEEAGLAAYTPTAGERPHISLAVYSDAALGEVETVLDQFVGEVSEITVDFGGVSTFPGAGVVYLAVRQTAPLKELHHRYHYLARGVSGHLVPHYAPGAWVPHCTLDMDLDPEIVPRVVELCSRCRLPETARLVEAGLVEFRPVKGLLTVPLSSASTGSDGRQAEADGRTT